MERGGRIGRPALRWIDRNPSTNALPYAPKVIKMRKVVNSVGMCP